MANNDLLNFIGSCLINIVSQIKPTEIYNLAAMSHVKISFQTAEYTADVDGIGTLRLLEAIRTVGINDKEFERKVNKPLNALHEINKNNFDIYSFVFFIFRFDSTKHLHQNYMERSGKYHKLK